LEATGQCDDAVERTNEFLARCGVSDEKLVMAQYRVENEFDVPATAENQMESIRREYFRCPELPEK